MQIGKFRFELNQRMVGAGDVAGAACAGAGGKTLAICSMLQNKGRVLAADVHERRVAEFAPRAARFQFVMSNVVLLSRILS